jgi:hypothetical protein
MPESCRCVIDPMFVLAERMKPRPRVVVEIGSFCGWWAHRCLRALSDVRLYCVDPWSPNWSEKIRRKRPWDSGDDIFNEWRWNTMDFGGRAIPIRMTSDEAATGWLCPYVDPKIDFLFIDGDHSFRQVLSDLVNWVPKVRPGGLIVGHDADKPKVRKAVDKFWPGGECVGQESDQDDKSEWPRRVLARDVFLPPEVHDYPDPGDGYFVNRLHYNGEQLTNCFWRFK